MTRRRTLLTRFSGAASFKSIWSNLPFPLMTVIYPVSPLVPYSIRVAASCRVQSFECPSKMDSQRHQQSVSIWPRSKSFFVRLPLSSSSVEFFATPLPAPPCHHVRFLSSPSFLAPGVVINFTARWKKNGGGRTKIRNSSARSFVHRSEGRK